MKTALAKLKEAEGELQGAPSDAAKQKAVDTAKEIREKCSKALSAAKLERTKEEGAK